MCMYLSICFNIYICIYVYIYICVYIYIYIMGCATNTMIFGFAWEWGIATSNFPEKVMRKHRVSHAPHEDVDLGFQVVLEE